MINWIDNASVGFGVVGMPDNKLQLNWSRKLYFLNFLNVFCLKSQKVALFWVKQRERCSLYKDRTPPEVDPEGVVPLPDILADQKRKATEKTPSKFPRLTIGTFKKQIKNISDVTGASGTGGSAAQDFSDLDDDDDVFGSGKF